MAYATGDYIIYKMQKNSIHPGPRARNIHPSAHGDRYYYLVDKYWKVLDVLGGDRLIAITRKGKRRILKACDRHLRKANVVERIFFRDKFPAER